MDISWDDLALFGAVAERGSFSEAARQLRVGQATISRRIARLEETLGHPLFCRTADGVDLTSLGQRLLPTARCMEAAAAEVPGLVAGAISEPEGLVRIAAPPGVATEFLVPFARDLKDRLPEIRVEVLSAIRSVDLLRAEADLALRTRIPGQPQLLTVASLGGPVRPYVSPEYRARLPEHPRLEDVAWLCFAPPYDQLAPGPQLAKALPGFCPSFTSDDFLVLTRAAELGLGALFLGLVDHRYRAASALVPLDLDLDLRGELHLVTTKTQLAIPRVARVARELLDALGAVAEAELEVYIDP